jgi:hypothetical protein
MTGEVPLLWGARLERAVARRGGVDPCRHTLGSQLLIYSGTPLGPQPGREWPERLGHNHGGTLGIICPAQHPSGPMGQATTTGPIRSRTEEVAGLWRRHEVVGYRTGASRRG